MVRYTSEAVAALGTGTLFGELALLNDRCRDATVSCWKDCEFLIIEKDDFDRVLKSELHNTQRNKVEFLRQHVPGVRALPETTAERILYYFHREVFPKNHVFVRQGSILTGDIYFVWEGAVESYSNLPDGGLRRRGILLKGSIFGAIPIGSPAPFTVMATTAPCEVLHVKPEFRKNIPESVLASVRENMEQTLVRRMHQCAPLMPLVPEVRSLSRPASTGSTSSCKQRRKRACLLPTQSHGLFQRVVTDVDHQVFELTPGETIAIKAQRPKPRDNAKRLLPKVLHHAQSMPSIRGKTGSQGRLL